MIIKLVKRFLRLFLLLTKWKREPLDLVVLNEFIAMGPSQFVGLLM
jgi:hypothetical protein